MTSKNSETGRSFNIRRPSRTRTLQETQDQEYVSNLADLRLADNNDLDRSHSPR